MATCSVAQFSLIQPKHFGGIRYFALKNFGGMWIFALKNFGGMCFFVVLQ